ncbi:hypothetical protein PENSPDRAFT_730799 [Peniophora sp. CONT]|nr:hypothetical protein PENSPDRAFT_730799 [Peniophora sp. CONT]
MGYAAYAVTSGLNVGVFDANEWPLAAHYVHDVPHGSRAEWKGYFSRADAQCMFDRMLNLSLVKIIDQMTGAITVLNPGSLRLRHASAPPLIMSPTGRPTPPPTPPVQSTSAPLPVRRPRRERPAQDGGRANPGARSHASIDVGRVQRRGMTLPAGESHSAGSALTSSSPRTGITQYGASHFSEASSRAGPPGSAPGSRRAAQAQGEPQPLHDTTHSRRPPSPEYANSDSSSSADAFSSPRTNASTQFSPPHRRNRHVSMIRSPTLTVQDVPSPRRERRGADHTLREEAINSWRQSVEVSPRAVRTSTRPRTVASSSHATSDSVSSLDLSGERLEDNSSLHPHNHSSHRGAASPRTRRDQASGRTSSSRSPYTFSMSLADASRVSNARGTELPRTPSSPRRRREHSAWSTTRGTEVLSGASPDPGVATSHHGSQAPMSGRSQDQLLPLLLGDNVNFSPRRGAARRQANSPQAIPVRDSPRRSDSPRLSPLRLPSVNSSVARQTDRRIHAPQDGTLQFSESDMDSSGNTDVDEESSVTLGTSQRTESVTTIHGSAARSPRPESIRRTQTAPNEPNTIVCEHCEGRGVLRVSSSAPIRRAATESSIIERTPMSSSTGSTPGPSRTASARSPTSIRQRSTASSELPATPERGSLSPRQQGARVHGPSTDPRSPILNGSTPVPGLAYFTRPTPPQSLAAFSLQAHANTQ